MSRRRPHEEDDGYGKLKLFCQGKCSRRCWVYIRSYTVFVLFLLVMPCVVLIGNLGITFGSVKSPLIIFMIYAFHLVIRIVET